MKRYILPLLAFLMLPVVGFSQGATGASIEGKVLNKDGEPLPGANVVAVHQPTGSRYGTSTRANGTYTLKGLRVGGPYVIKVTFVGYSAAKKELTSIGLDETIEINFQLEQGNLQLKEVVVTAEVNPVFDNEHMGARTNISTEEIARIPTISRSITSFTRLSPLSTGGFSFGGANNRYNNFLVDGATMNATFGLEAMPGTEAGLESAISADAIAEFNVSTAPFGVTNGGFTGAQVNAITRSGTNEFSGSAYFYTRNEAFVGNYELNRGNDIISSDISEFKENTYGLRIGGPIVQDELFFFVSLEMRKERHPINGGLLIDGDNNFGESGFDEVFRFPKSKFQQIRQIAKNVYGYDPGGFGSRLFTEETGYKALLKLNWNISEKHKLMLRYNYVDYTNQEGISRSRGSYSFANRRYDFTNKQHSVVAELTSTFSPNLLNTARVVYTRIRDDRTPVSKPFPEVAISVQRLGNKVDYSDDFGKIYMGMGRFAQKNYLAQDLIEITDNLTYIMGDHEFTFGTSNKIFMFENIYFKNAWGSYVFRGIDDFKDGDPYSYQVSYVRPGGTLGAEFYAIQVGLYAQDEWTVNDRLTVTVGLRADVPFMPKTPGYNPDIPKVFSGYTTDRMATGNVLWQPRFGFHWDLSSDETVTQIRGGIGIFSGPPPYVWISNQFSNTGIDYGRLNIEGSGAFDDGFTSLDPFNPPTPNSNPQLHGQASTAVNLISEDFKYPSSLKMNLAIDQELPLGISFTLEGIYSNAINAVTYRNLNLQQTGTSIYGRPLYGLIYYDGYYRNAGAQRALKSDKFTNVILLENSDKGHRYTITAQLKKQFYSGLYVSLAYTYNRAFSVNAGSSSQAISNFKYVESVDVNNPKLGTSAWERRHRILANVSYRFSYLDGFFTTVSVVYSGFSGTPFSWTYNGNANGDLQFDNDLVYVPRDLDPYGTNEILLATENWAAMDAFINSHPSLDEYRGGFVQRNTAREPWTNYLDLKITQEIPTYRDQSIEISMSLINVLNFLNSEWGTRESVSFNNYAVWTLKQYATKQYIANHSYLSMDDLGKPVISFDPAKVEPSQIFNTYGFGSRWKLQVGVRYNF